MTNADILVPILSEISGDSPDAVLVWLDAFSEIMGGRFKLEAQITDEQGGQLLASLRRELPEIRACLAEGIRQAQIKIKLDQTYLTEKSALHTPASTRKKVRPTRPFSNDLKGVPKFRHLYASDA